MAEESAFITSEPEEEAGYPKADVLERFLARLIDFLVAGALFAFPTAVGPLASLTYILISDGLRVGSIGKRIIGLKVVSLRTGQACDFKESIIRNSVFGGLIIVYIVIGWVPYIGKILAFLVWAAVIGGECLLIYTDDAGSRFGDRIAGTMVVSSKAPVKI